MSIELRNINGFSADIYEKETNVMIASWSFCSPPHQMENEKSLTIRQLKDLKDAGFTTQDILDLTEKICIKGN